VPLHFILDFNGGAWRKQLTKEGFDVTLAGRAIDFRGAACILDGYAFGASECEAWRKCVDLVAIFCDSSSPVASADVVIDIAGGSSSVSEPRQHVLAGLNYSLVSQEFTNLEPREPNGVNHVVVCFGARDTKNGTLLTLIALEEIVATNPNICVTVAIGAAAPHLSSLRHFVSKSPMRVRIAVNESNMPELLNSADIAVGAGGVGLLERMASGVPSITSCIADNQRAMVEQAAKGGGTIAVDPLECLTVEKLQRAVCQLMEDSALRASMVARGRQLIDAQGGGRLATALMEVLRSKQARLMPSSFKELSASV